MFTKKYEIEMRKFDTEKDKEIGHIKLLFDTEEEMNDVLMSIISAESSPQIITFKRRKIIVEE